MTDKTMDKHKYNSVLETGKNLLSDKTSEKLEFSADSDVQLTSSEDVITESSIKEVNIINDSTSDDICGLNDGIELNDCNCIIDPVPNFDDFINMLSSDS